MYGLPARHEAAATRLDQEAGTLEEKVHQVKKKGIDWVYNPLGRNFLATPFDTVTAAQWNNIVQARDAGISSLREHPGSTSQQNIRDSVRGMADS